MKKTTARNSRGALRFQESRETELDRFEFARKHILQTDKLQLRVDEAERSLWEWQYGEDGTPDSNVPLRKPRTPEDREDLKALEAALIDARARLLLHENDGYLL